jgi:hypothetical protein
LLIINDPASTPEQNDGPQGTPGEQKNSRHEQQQDTRDQRPKRERVRACRTGYEDKAGRAGHPAQDTTQEGSPGKSAPDRLLTLRSIKPAIKIMAQSNRTLARAEKKHQAHSACDQGSDDSNDVDGLNIELVHRRPPEFTFGNHGMLAFSCTQYSSSLP